MVYVTLTGPVEIPTTAGPFESVDTRVETMSTRFSVNTASDVHKAFTAPVYRLLDDYTEEGDRGDESYTPVDTHGTLGKDSDWDVEMSGGLTNRFYEWACELTAEAGDDAPDYMESPISLLLHWSATGRYGPRTDGPEMAAKVAMKSILVENDCTEDYSDADKSWDTIIDNYHDFDFQSP